MPAKRGNKDAFIAAFRVTGEISKAAKASGTRRELHYRRLEKDPKYKAAFEAACVDIAAKREHQAHQKVSVSIEGNLRAEMRRLNGRMTELSKSLRRKIRDLEAKLADAAPRAPRQRPTEADALLDQISRGMGKKPFSRLSPAHQDAVREIAARIKGSEQAD